MGRKAPGNADARPLTRRGSLNQPARGESLPRGQNLFRLNVDRSSIQITYCLAFCVCICSSTLLTLGLGPFVGGNSFRDSRCSRTTVCAGTMVHILSAIQRKYIWLSPMNRSYGRSV